MRGGEEGGKRVERGGGIWKVRGGRRLRTGEGEGSQPPLAETGLGQDVSHNSVVFILFGLIRNRCVTTSPSLTRLSHAGPVLGKKQARLTANGLPWALDYRPRLEGEDGCHSPWHGEMFSYASANPPGEERLTQMCCFFSLRGFLPKILH